MSLGQTNVEICVLSKTHRKLLFNNLSIVWNIKILLITFCQESPQMLCAKFGGNGWNCLGEVRKSRFATFREFAMACMTRFSTIQWTRGYMVFECATKYMWVTSQNTHLPWLLSFGACSGSEKCNHLGRKSGHSKNNRDLAGRDLLGP